jgi:hypothetical protein
VNICKSIASFFIILIVTVQTNISVLAKEKEYTRKDILICSAYHFRAKLNNQYSMKQKYDYHSEYFEALQRKFLVENQQSSLSDYILSITSIMESWSYIAQEHNRNYANNKIESEYGKLCNTILK